MTSSSHNSESASEEDNSVENLAEPTELPTTWIPSPAIQSPAPVTDDGEMTIAAKLAGSKRKRNLPGTSGNKRQSHRLRMTSPSQNSTASADAVSSASGSKDPNSEDNPVEPTELPATSLAIQPLAIQPPPIQVPAPVTDDGEMTIAAKLAGIKRKRNLPGTPAPDAEVVALSPKTLMATHKFICEVCGRGFQREQNLQLHKRGHNLPGTLKPRINKDKEVRKKVYVCPEATCVHHDPSRALGDLTGIKKHFCRKHGEKKWKCEKCSKKYAVLSDWKAHSKTCGTRDYKCECGSIFHRRDSFVTHKAFCDELAEESAKLAAAKAGSSQLYICGEHSGPGLQLSKA